MTHEITIWLNSDKSDVRESIADSTDIDVMDVHQKLSYLGYEVGLVYEINNITGESKLLRVIAGKDTLTPTSTQRGF